MLNKDYDVNYFSFVDDQLTLNRGHIMDLCNEILKFSKASPKTHVWDILGACQLTADTPESPHLPLS